MWAYRKSGSLFGGDYLSLAGGESGYRYFASNIDPTGANPPWAWKGDQSCHVGQCYYHFWQDGTNNFSSQVGLPTTDWGTFLAMPEVDVGQRFGGLTELNLPVQYDPYLASPPTYYGPQPLSATIDGPEMVPAGTPETWNAVITGGTAPYTIQWSGAFSGNQTSVSGSLSSDATLYLDVWDAANNHTAISIYITVCQNGQISC